MKVERYQMAVAKRVDQNTTMFKRVQHASKRKVLDGATELMFKGFSPIGRMEKRVVTI